jgi:hypothetical protein
LEADELIEGEIDDRAGHGFKRWLWRNFAIVAVRCSS